MKWLFLIFIILSQKMVWGEDTIFIKTLNIGGRANNIDTDGRQLLIRLNDKTLLYFNNQFEPISQHMVERYSWFSKSLNDHDIKIFHTQYPLPEKLAQPEEVENLLPGFYTNNITTAMVGNSYFICYRGNVLEYRIDKDIKLRYPGKSVRHIFCNDSLRITSTYSGIFIDRTSDLDKFNSTAVQGTDYSNGELSLINGNYYLCQDGLHILSGDSLFRRISSEIKGAAFRKLLVWNGKVICMFNSRVSEFNVSTLQEDRILVDGAEFSDIETFEGQLLCCDASGRFFKITENGVTDTIMLNCPIYDICVAGDEVIVSGDSGLFILDSLLKIKKMNSGMASIQAVKQGPYVFFTNFEGLFLLTKDTVYTIVENIEFNKKALSIYNNYLYAGSVDGLYTIQMSSFESKVFPSLKPILVQIKVPENYFWKSAVVVLVILLIITLLYYFRNRKTKENIEIPETVYSITPEFISALIKDNPELTTVQSIAERLETSVVQLNRKLKPFGETPLSVMLKTKKDIALEMHKNGVAMELISKRTGYSKRYIRENFLNSD